MTSVDVVVPTYRRPEHLAKCLRSLARQTRTPDRIFVVARIDDEASQMVVDAARAALPAAELVTVDVPGVIAAMSAGVVASRSGIVAFTDDDAAPRPDWIERLLRHFTDPTIGVVGGRDLMPHSEESLAIEVGIFRRWGGLIGNHHLGTGPVRDVDVLKGVNIAFRADALALPKPGVLRGSGAQVDWEVMCCTHARQLGWRIIYDPALLVDHEAARRHGADLRTRPASAAVFDSAYNSVAACGAERSLWLRRAVFGVLVGGTDRPGVLRTAAGLLRWETEVLRRSAPSLTGQLAALVFIARRRCLRSDPVITASALRQHPPERLRVAVVAHDIHDQGGMERACAELIRHSHDEIAFTVISAELDPALRLLVAHWIRVRIPRRPFPLKFVAFFVLVGFVLRHTHVDLVHTIGAIVPNRVDVAGIHFCHAGHRAATGSLAPVKSRPLRRANTTISRTLALLAERWCFRPTRLRAFAAVSGGVAGELQTHYPQVPVTVTPNGVDLDRFRPDPEARRETRREQAISPEQTIALFVGGDWGRKGLGLAVEAVAKARANGADVVLWVVGPGDEARFRTLAEDLGVADVVAFLGTRADTERYYQAADLFVLPSAYETFSLVCFEAAACGLPLVIPPLHGASDLVGEDEAGLVVQRDATDIARAIASLSGDEELRLRLGREAARRASEFGWDASAAAVTDLYRSLLDERSRR